MRFTLWLTALFGMAVASALLLSNNQGTITLYWPSYRVDMSLNLALLVIALLFVLLHLALKTLSSLLSLPQKARRWRLSYKERAIHSALLDAIAHLYAGRFVRARKAAESILAIENAMRTSEESLPDAIRLRTLAHLLAAESAHALQDRTQREQHLQHALHEAAHRQAHDLHDGVQLRAARWALDERDAHAALQWLEQLPVGTARRTLALRLRFKAARQARNSRQALEAARLLTKHRAFSELAGMGIARSLALELLRSAQDASQVQQAWAFLDSSERQLPDITLEAAERWLDFSGDTAVARDWLLPLWDKLWAASTAADPVIQALQTRLVTVLERSFSIDPEITDPQWLQRIESAQTLRPGDALLHYLAAIVCVRLRLWGKAQAQLRQALPLLKDAALIRRAWLTMAELAEQRQDPEAAATAYRCAAKASIP